MKYTFLLFIFFNAYCFGQQSSDTLFYHFTKAYDELDAEKVANLYTEKAEILNLYDADKPNSAKGRADIKKIFPKFLSSI